MSRAAPAPEYLRPAELAARLACRVEMILDAIATGALPGEYTATISTPGDAAA